MSSDHIYRMPFRINKELPNPTQVTSQTAWYANTRNCVLRQIRALCCEEREFVEVTHVRRTNRRNEQKYMLDGDKKQYDLDGAVDRVMELVAERKKLGNNS